MKRSFLSVLFSWMFCQRLTATDMLRLVRQETENHKGLPVIKVMKVKKDEGAHQIVNHEELLKDAPWVEYGNNYYRKVNAWLPKETPIYDDHSSSSCRFYGEVEVSQMSYKHSNGEWKNDGRGRVEIKRTCESTAHGQLSFCRTNFFPPQENDK